MGLLALGTALDWPDAQKLADHVRSHGIQQFLHIWERVKNRRGDGLLWGDEIEYMVISFDDEHKNAMLSLRQSEILRELQLDEIEMSRDCPGLRRSSFLAAPYSSPSYSLTIPKFHAEFGRYMLESTPGAPYGAGLHDLLGVEGNMKLRRRTAKAKMKDNETPLTITSFPRLGVPGQFLDPHHEPNGPTFQSLFLPDQLINPHIRFPTLAANIRKRRGSKVAINMPIFFDENTPRPFIDPTIPWDRELYPGDREAKDGAALPDHIYMDAMGFGMGCSCLQITFQAQDIFEARRIYDALIPVGPIMLALTAAAPIFRGYLADVDCRWNVIAGSVDDRTEEERGLKPLKNNRFRIPKSRYDSVDSYLSQDAINRPEYNDTYLPIDADIKKTLLNKGIDELLANHIAHLFIRDPIVIFSETIDQDDATSSDHFENIQSTNWQTMRFKPPPPNSNIGWRVEFRSMEVQITDFENAAFSIFIVLLTRAILSFGLNFYLPISKVDQNMARAHRRAAVSEQKFYFRKKVFINQSGKMLYHLYRKDAFPATAANGANVEPIKPDGYVLSNGERFTSPFSSTPASHSGAESPEKLHRVPVDDEYDEFTIDQVINGKPDEGTSKRGTFPGLLPLVQAYLNSLHVEPDVKASINRYLEVIRQRANGKLPTAATWIRSFVQAHPSYKKDSVINQEINYDLMKEIDAMESGRKSAAPILGALYQH
ncbi:GCS-domain-containing protein [Atractiella rhizophila]|nr:GCS-domain-containing protein [Atractiella rhizophila]